MRTLVFFRPLARAASLSFIKGLIWHFPCPVSHCVLDASEGRIAIPMFSPYELGREREPLITPQEPIGVEFDMLNVQVFAARKGARVDDQARCKAVGYAVNFEVEVGRGGLLVAIALTVDTKAGCFTVGIALVVEMDRRGGASLTSIPLPADLHGKVCSTFWSNIIFDFKRLRCGHGDGEPGKGEKGEERKHGVHHADWFEVGIGYVDASEGENSRTSSAKQHRD